MTFPTLEDVAKDLTIWRKTRLKRGPIPHLLQRKISSLSSQYRVSEITKTLGLNTAQLKAFKQVPKKTPKTPVVKFIRLGQPQGLNKVQCHLKRSDGSTLECSLESSQLNKLIEAFLC